MTIEALRIDFDVAVPMRDGTQLRADVYRPTDGTWPALLIRTPYSKAALPALLPTLDPVRAARDGYAVVVQDTRGRFASDGEFAPFVEGDDGHDTIEWVASMDWCDGRVGMFGSSYMAATQLQAAATRPAALKAIAPVHGSSDYYEGRSYRGGAFEIGSLATICLWALARGTLQRDPSLDYAQNMLEVRRALDDLASFLSGATLASLRGSVLGRVAPVFFDWAEHDRDDHYWRALSLESRYSTMDVAALHITSWFDQYHVGTLRNFEGLTNAVGTTDHSAQALVIGPWPHYVPKTGMIGTARLGDIDFGLEAVVDLEGLQMRWFREHLSGERGAWRQRSPVRLFMMGENRWRDEASWPVEGASIRSLYLGSSGSLQWAPPSDQSPAEFDFDPRSPVPTRGGAHLVLESAFPSGPLDHRDVDARPDVLVFTSPPLEEDIEIVGWIEAELSVRSTAPSTDFTAKVLDVWPDGRLINIVDGIRRLTTDVTADSSGWIRAHIPLGATAILMRRGHAICVHISSSNHPRFDVNPNTGASSLAGTQTVVAHQTVRIGGQHASRIQLPIRAHHQNVGSP